MKLQFFVSGTPAPGGSKTAIPMYDGAGNLVTKPTEKGRQRPVMRYVDDAKGNVAWRKVVGFTAKNKMQWARLQPCAGALRFTCEFVVERGKTVTRPHPTVPPDLSKFIRSTEDALTGIAWVDDSQIIEHGIMRKRYARPGEQTGAHILIESLAEEVMELKLVTTAEPHIKSIDLSIPRKDWASPPQLEDSPFA